MINFTEVINIIPEIIMYVLPGVAFWKSFYFVSLKTGDKISGKSKWTTMVLLSFLIMQPFYLIGWPANAIFRNGLIILFSLTLGLAFGFLSKSQWINEIILAKIFHRTSTDDMWSDIMDLKNGVYIELKSLEKGTTIFGSIRGQYQHSGDTWLTIQGYKISHKNKSDANVDYTNDSTRVLLVKLSEYSIVELVYSSESLKIK